MPEPQAVSSRAGDSAGFESLMRAHYARLCDFAFYQVHSRDIAEDIVQDVFTQLWKGRETLEMHDPLRYLYQAVRNRVINHRRRQGTREGWVQYVMARKGEIVEESHAAAVEAADLAEAYGRALDQLPERCRLVFLLSREQGLTYPEIARTLDLSVKTVETQIGRALKQLRLRLRPYLCLAMALLPGVRFFA